MSPSKVSTISGGDSLLLTTDWSSSGEQCTLPEDVKNIALKELREDKNTRLQSLMAFQQWISKNPDVQNVNMEGKFLLRFLRTKKYSLPMAQQMLLKYLNLRQKYPMYFMNLDCLNPSVNELIDSGYLFVSPYRDSHGRRVTIASAKNFDIKKYSNIDLGLTHVITYEALLNDEVNQVMGINHFGDLASISPAYITLFGPTEFATLIKWGEQSVPMRHKEIHLLNVPTAVKYAYDFFLTRLSPKICGRIKMYSSVSELDQCIDKKVLPKEYGGEMPMAEMISLWKKELLACRADLLALDKMRLVTDKNIIRSKMRLDDINGSVAGFNQLNGSFRKLEVD